MKRLRVARHGDRRCGIARQYLYCLRRPPGQVVKCEPART